MDFQESRTVFEHQGSFIRTALGQTEPAGTFLALQSGAAGFETGKEERLTNGRAPCLAGVAWVLLTA